MKRRRRSPVRRVAVSTAMCPPEEVARILGSLRFFEGLGESEVHAVLPRFRQIGCAPGETIYREGSPAERLYVVAEGSVKILRPTAAGREVVIEFLGRGDFFGNLSGLASDIHAETATAQTEVCLLSIGAAGFRELMERHPSVAVRVVAITAEQLKAAHDMIQLLGANPVDQRIASVLLVLADRLGERRAEGILIQLPLSREELAGMVGTTPETASRIMSRLQAEGVVASGRRWIAIRDRARLADIAGR